MRTSSELVLGDLHSAGSSRSDPLGHREPQPGSVRTYAARTTLRLEDIEAKWREIEAKGFVTAYQRLDWIRFICDDLLSHSTSRPVFVDVFDAETGETVMLLPLMLKRRFGLRIIAWLDLDVCDYAAPLLAARSDMTAEAAHRCWAAARSVLPPHDLAVISQIPASIAGVRNPLALLPEARCMDLTASGTDLGGDPATLLQRVCSKSGRKELNKFMRRLERQGEVRLVRASNEVEVAAMFECLLDQRRRRFQALGRFDLFSRAGVADFYRNAALGGLSGGPATLWGLSVDGECIATAYCLISDNICYGLVLTAAGSSWKTCSPGIVMVGGLMEHAARLGLVYMDMTIGSLPYKASFGAQTKPLWQIHHCKTILGFALWTSNEMVVGSKSWVQSHPRTFEKLRQFRRAFRRRSNRPVRPGND